MKKKILSMLAVLLTGTIAFSVFSFGSKDGEYLDPYENIYGGGTDLSVLHVRVNGREVRFTDAHPYIDENNRTMIPLRAAVEALGAEVTWSQATRTASISKNGVTVDVTIGSDTLTVNDNGVLSYVTMDTMAVLNPEEGRTYVPIRYVAESLGAFVDYSDAFRTVGIYQDQLTPDEIRYLQSFDWDLACTVYEGGWEDVRADFDTQESFELLWPYHAVSPKSFANARECMYDSATSFFSRIWMKHGDVSELVRIKSSLLSNLPFLSSTISLNSTTSVSALIRPAF